MKKQFSGSLDNDEIRQRISHFLNKGETILWLGKPANWTTISPLLAGLALVLIIAGTSLYAGYWLALPADLVEKYSYLIGLSNRPLIPALIMTGAGLFLGVTSWHRRPSKWAYAITDRRLVVVFGNTLLREKTPRELKYVRVNSRQGEMGDVYWEIRSGRFRNAYDENGKPLNRGPDGYHVGFKGQSNAGQLCTEILNWQKQSIESELKTSTASAESYLSSVDQVEKISSDKVVASGSQLIHNSEHGFSVEVPADWVTQVSQRKKGILPFLGMSFLDNIVRDGAFKPYTENLDWNLLITKGTEESWLEIYSSPGKLTTDWNTVVNDPWAARLNQKVINQIPNLSVGEFKGFSITRSMSPEVNIPNYGTTKTDTHIQMSWLSNGKLSLEFRAIVAAHSLTLQQTVATKPQHCVSLKNSLKINQTY